MNNNFCLIYRNNHRNFQELINTRENSEKASSFEECYSAKYSESQLRLAIGQREWSNDHRSENRINQFLWFQLAIMQVRGAMPADGTVYQSTNGLSFDRQNSDGKIGIRGSFLVGIWSDRRTEPNANRKPFGERVPWFTLTWENITI